SKWSFQLGASWILNTGNVTNQTFNNDATVERNDSTLAFSAYYKYVYTETDDDETNNGFNAGLKFDIWQYDRLSPFFASEYVRNKYKGYDNKLSVLGGVKLRIYTIPKVCDYSLSGAVVADFVDYTDDETELDSRVYRWSARLKIKHKLNDAVNFNHSTFYQPSIYEPREDWLLTSVTKLETKIASHLFFDATFSYEYRSLIPDDVDSHHDTETTLSLRVKF
ncbi:MAG: DUF481 domain-containing protein, partial [Fibrobacter sp.]|nr:DUF481 domain-containing protein [Fibrobacter sp.]